MAKVHSDKNHDYAGFGDHLANFKLCEHMGIPAWKGALVRICDKVARLWSFAERGELNVAEERVEDTLIDLAVYSILTVLLFKEREGAGDGD